MTIVLNGREVADVYEAYYLGAGVVLLCCAWAFQVRSGLIHVLRTITMSNAR
jgi:hypothetical protein